LKALHDVKVFVRDEKTVVWRYVREIAMNYNSSKNLKCETLLLFIGVGFCLNVW